ncbi:MAG: DNA polymerase III subunit gamma/tau [Bacteroidetes bacterium]|nr:MAG: DNA polymerase III subunit gamma/tau [Bacteroidota bacterium]
MEQFIVSARKYRPATFDTVVGQGHITTTLKNALKNNHLAQAFLFCGPRGVGKTTCARILAKTINCTNLTPDHEACGKCDSCVAFQKNGSMNVYELDAASNNSVDDIRNLVEQVRFPPQMGTRKVYIIDEVHMLSTAAFNAFLKTLEEPPSYVIFILATTEKHKIIPTILSRCQIFDFKRIEVRDMAGHLQNIAQKENIKAEYDALELIAQKADGGLRDALSMFDMISTFSFETGITYKTTLENLHILDYDYYFRMTDALWREDSAEAFLVLEEILRQGFDGHNFIVGLAKHFRDLLVCRDERTIKLLEATEKVRKQYLAQAGMLSPAFIITALNIASQCDSTYKGSKAPRLHIEIALMKIANLNTLFNFDKLNATALAESAKKKLANSDSKPIAQTDQEATAPQVQEAPQNAYMKTLGAIGSIGNLQTIKQQAVQQAQEAKEAQTKEPRPLTTELMYKIIDHFLKVQLKNDVRVQKIFVRPPVIKGEYALEFQLTEAEQEIFKPIENAFLILLKKALYTEQASLSVTTYVEKPIRRIYTNKDKFDYLAEKQPLLQELAEKLGLDIDI